MKNKAILFVLFIVCVLCALSVANTPENKTIRYFNSHRTVLAEDISNCTDAGQATSRLNITFNYWDGEHPIVEYIVVRRGIVPASRYYGFFYSFDDTPVAFQNAGVPLTPVSQQEWAWRGEGDNHGVVRRLDTNWFYFEASL